MERQVSTERQRIGLRVPEGLKLALERDARKSGRTLNSEIVSRLLESYAKTPGDAPPEMAQPPARNQGLRTRVAALEDAVQELRSLLADG